MSKLSRFNQIMWYVLAAIFGWSGIARLFAIGNHFIQTQEIDWWKMLLCAGNFAFVALAFKNAGRKPVN